MIERYQFAHGVQVQINHADRQVITRFQDGIELTAIPNYDAESSQRAAYLGYTGQDPVWDMTRDHDLLHSLLADIRGAPYSHTLYRVAHYEPLAKEHANREERTVLFLQRAKNQGIQFLLDEHRTDEAGAPQPTIDRPLS